MYKVANAQRVILFSGLYFLLLGNLFASSGSHDEDFPTTISYETMTEQERAEAGFVAAVDSGKLTGEKSWSYTLQQGGDYQLGTGWVEALSEGKVKIVISVNGKAVKTVTALKDKSKAPGLSARDYGLFRLESRFEGLAADTRIDIKAVPSGDVAYRLAFHLVSTTPDFTGLKVLNVADFGAVGDGLIDDMAAIHKAVAAAKAAGGAIIRFEKKKTYRVVGRDDLEYEAVFDLVGAANIKIEGQGSTLVLKAPNGMANIRQSRNIQIDGLLVDYDPLPYYQGKITNIDVENMTIDIVVPKRYPVPLTGKTESKAAFFGRSFIPDRPGSRSGSGENIYIESVTALKDGRHLRLQVPKFAKGSDTPNAANKSRVLNAKKRGATEFVVPHMKYGHLKGYTSILQSSRVTFSNIRYYLVPYFWMKVKGNTGPVSFQNVDLKMKHPETELYASWRDGFHIKNGRFGTLIDSCDMDGAAQYDDTFAIYTRIHNVAAIDTKNRKLSLDAAFRDHKDLHTWLKGDWVSIWNKNQTILRGMARVVEAENVPESQKRFYLSLEHLPSSIRPGDVVINDEVLNRGTLIRNCSTSSTGTEYASNRFRASGITYENNRFEDFNFYVEFNPFWGTPRARDVLVKGCYIGGGESAVQLHWPIGMVFEKCRFDRVTFTGVRNAEDIVLRDAEWLNAGRLIHAGAGSTLYLEGDIRLNGKTVNPQGSDIKRRISIAKGAAVHLPGDSKPAVKRPTIKEKITGGVIVTIGDPGYKETGTWSDSGLAGYQGGKSRFSDKGGSSVFTSPLEKAGTCKVYVYRLAHPNNDARQGIVINHGGGSENLVVDMCTSPSGWVDLGSYSFKGNGQENVVVKPGSGISPARCSAVMFVPVTPENGQGGIKALQNPGKAGVSTAYGENEGDLVTPVMTEDPPAPGKRVRQVAAEYKGTAVYHSLYLPINWEKGKTFPVIVEYTGNKWPHGPGTVEAANLGYGMSGGKDYIWVTMPCVEKGRKENAVTWWGDRQATIDYCKVNLPRICKQWGGDPKRVVVCGFSRGAIGTSYIGLADDHIASLWAGIFTFDHFDGHRKWGYPESDRASALKRLARLKGRPVLVGGQNPVDKGYLEDHFGLAKFTFLKVPTGSIFKIPGGVIQSTHTDIWMHRDSTYRRRVRAWLRDTLKENKQ